MKVCGPIHPNQAVPNRYQQAVLPLDKEKPQQYRRRSKSRRSLLDTRSVSPQHMMPPSSPNSRAVSGRSRSTRRVLENEDCDHRLRSRSSYERERFKPIDGGKSRSRFSSQHQFSDPACPFDVNGYCVIHKDVHMAKLKGSKWKILREECTKCIKRNGSGSMTDQTETSTQDETFDSLPHQATSGRRVQREKYRDEQQTVTYSGSRRESARSSYVDERRESARSSYVDEKQEVQKSRNSFYSVDEGLSRNRPSIQEVKKSGNSFHSTRSRHDEISQSERSGSKNCEYDQQYYENIDNTSCGNRSRRGRNEHRGREEISRSKSRVRPPRNSSRGDLSRLSRSSRSGGDHFSKKHMSRPKPKTICVNGVPFDKNGCCFLHPHVKLASKKLLGGWKVHNTFCRACAFEQCDDDQSALTSRSGHSSLPSQNASHHSVCSDYSENTRSRSVAGSVKSSTTNLSVRSWTSNQSRKRAQKDDSFLPLDAEGYCTYHPEVRLAKMGKHGEWKVLMDFCPECAEVSLMIGGAPGSKPSKLHRSKKVCDVPNIKTSKSNHNDKTFVEKMPFIDNDGKPGHYTGYLDMDGRPSGRGKMKYVDGKKFDGIWKEGNQIQGKVSYKKKSSKDKSANSEKKKKTRRKSSEDRMFQ